MRSFVRSLVISVLIFACVLFFLKFDLPGARQVGAFVEYVVTSEYNWEELRDRWGGFISKNFPGGADQLWLRIREVREVLAERIRKTQGK